MEEEEKKGIVEKMMTFPKLYLSGRDSYCYAVITLAYYRKRKIT